MAALSPHYQLISSCGEKQQRHLSLSFSGTHALNTLWTGDADLRLYITTVQDG